MEYLCRGVGVRNELVEKLDFVVVLMVVLWFSG